MIATGARLASCKTEFLCTLINGLYARKLEQHKVFKKVCLVMKMYKKLNSPV